MIKYYPHYIIGPDGIIEEVVSPDLGEALLEAASKAVDDMNEFSSVMETTTVKFDFTDMQAALEKQYPLLDNFVKCPASGCGEEDALSYIIIELNDQHKWSREKIADWIETIEGEKDGTSN